MFDAKSHSGRLQEWSETKAGNRQDDLFTEIVVGKSMEIEHHYKVALARLDGSINDIWKWFGKLLASERKRQCKDRSVFYGAGPRYTICGLISL